MKNLYLLPTDQPSRLVKIKDTFFITTTDDIPGGTFYNIHITKDEEIKDGDWMIRGNEQPTLVTPNFFWDFGVRYYKIILTTDSTLIANGVQVIDDEFLKWFVKNPSCEFVEVNKKLVEFPLTFKMMYKIIIPQDEPKEVKYTEDEVRELLIKGLTHNDDKLCGSLVTVQKEIRTANFNVWFEENKKK